MIPTFIQNVPEYSVWSYFVKEIGLPIFLYKKPHKENYFSPLQPKLPFLIQKRFQKPSLIICKCSKRLFEHITALILIIFSKKQEFCVNLHVTYKLLRFPKIVPYPGFWKDGVRGGDSFYTRTVKVLQKNHFFCTKLT